MHFSISLSAKSQSGTAYIVWTGIGGVGTFIVGVLFFGDSASMLRFLGVFLIISVQLY
ncbi:MAG: SMR family transporter [Wolinella sp.]